MSRIIGGGSSVIIAVCNHMGSNRRWCTGDAGNRYAIVYFFRADPTVVLTVCVASCCVVPKSDHPSVAVLTRFEVSPILLNCISRRIKLAPIRETGAG